MRVQSKKSRFQYEYAVRLEKTNIPPTWKGGQAGVEWFRGFMRRHPRLSMRLPEATSLARASAFNRSNVNAFFNNYEQVIKSHFPNFNAAQIWNIDEMGLTTAHTPNRVISRRGRKQVGRITSTERGQTVSMALAISASGIRAPPYLIFPRARFHEHFLNNGPPICWGEASPSGFMNSETFLDFIQKFQGFVRCSPENPILLILDNHGSHRTFDVLKFCRENGIHVLSFPPHTSHRLQPLDVAVFGPVQNACNQLCEDWVTTHPGRVMQIFDLPPVFRRGLELGAGEVNITSGFRASGVWPFDRQIFTDIDFLPSKTTDRPLPENLPDVNIDLPESLNDEELELRINDYLRDVPNDHEMDAQ